MFRSGVCGNPKIDAVNGFYEESVGDREITLTHFEIWKETSEKSAPVAAPLARLGSMELDEGFQIPDLDALINGAMDHLKKSSVEAERQKAKDGRIAKDVIYLNPPHSELGRRLAKVRDPTSLVARSDTGGGVLSDMDAYSESKFHSYKNPEVIQELFGSRELASDKDFAPPECLVEDLKQKSETFAENINSRTRNVPARRAAAAALTKNSMTLLSQRKPSASTGPTTADRKRSFSSMSDSSACTVEPRAANQLLKRQVTKEIEQSNEKKFKTLDAETKEAKKQISTLHAKLKASETIIKATQNQVVEAQKALLDRDGEFKKMTKNHQKELEGAKKQMDGNVKKIVEEALKRQQQQFRAEQQKALQQQQEEQQKVQQQLQATLQQLQQLQQQRTSISQKPADDRRGNDSAPRSVTDIKETSRKRGKDGSAGSTRGTAREDTVEDTEDNDCGRVHKRSRRTSFEEERLRYGKGEVVGESYSSSEEEEPSTDVSSLTSLMDRSRGNLMQSSSNRLKRQNRRNNRRNGASFNEALHGGDGILQSLLSSMSRAPAQPRQGGSLGSALMRMVLVKKIVDEDIDL